MGTGGETHLNTPTDRAEGAEDVGGGSYGVVGCHVGMDRQVYWWRVP